MATDLEPLSGETAEKNMETIFRSAGDVMKDALFSEIITYVENSGVVVTLLEGSRKIHILQEAVDLLQDVRVLGLTQDVCRVLISRQMLTADLNNKSPGISASGRHATPMSSKQSNQSRSQRDSPPKEGVKSALFNEIVQAVIQNECSLIMTTGLKSVATLEKVVEILGSVRIIHLSPVTSDMLLVNKVGDLGKEGTHTKDERTVRRPVSEERTCHICNKKFSKRSGLLTHQKAFHEKCLPHKCELCTRAFVYPKELRLHKMSAHTGYRPYHCEVCNKGFVSRKDLERHAPVHTGVRAFVCTVCNAAFTCKANLDRHVKSKHKGQRPYVCSLCVDKKYCDRGGLRKHLASVHRIFDLPRKRVIHRRASPGGLDDADLTNVQNSNLSGTKESHEGHVTHQHSTGRDILRETAAIVGITGPSSSTGSRHVETAGDFSSMENASKILQQLSQSVAAGLLGSNTSASPGLTDITSTLPKPSGNMSRLSGSIDETSPRPVAIRNESAPSRVNVLEQRPSSGGIVSRESGDAIEAATDRGAAS